MVTLASLIESLVLSVKIWLILLVLDEEHLLLEKLLLLLLLLLLLCRFIAFAQAVLNADIFLLGELQLVDHGQEDAFTLHV